MVTLADAPSALTDATISVQALLVVANTGLTLIAGHFLREFVADVRKLTERVHELETQVAVLKAVVNGEVEHFSKNDAA